MKTCPFCAEEIQDAAVVCKHCGRDLAPAPPATAKPRGGRIALIVLAVLTLPFMALYCGAEHQQFLAFDAQRDAWHRRCDAYLNTPLTNPSAAACNRELNEMVAYAKRQGWD